MKTCINNIFLLTLILGIYATGVSGAKKVSALKENSALLERLDSLISKHDEIVAQKERRIDRLRRDYIQSASNTRKMEICKSLFKEYSVYDSDSAMKYAKEATRLARHAEPADPDRVASCLLNEIFIYTTQGFNDDAMRMLESIDPALLSNEMKLQYFHTGQYIYSSRALFNANGDISDPSIGKSNAFRDSLVRLDPNHLHELLWAPIAIRTEKDPEKYDPPMKEVELLKRAVDSSTEATRENAINAYWLSRHYKRMGDEVNMVKYLTLASLFDTEIENREIAAITELAEWLYDHDDLDRAYTYLIYSSDQANAYHNRARLLNVSTLLPTIRQAYHDAIMQRDHKLHVYVWVLIGLSLILIGVVVFSILENHRLRRTRKALSEANDQLKQSIIARDEAISDLEESKASLEESNLALSDANVKLKEAAVVKEELVAMSYRLASDHINALDEYRKKLLKKYKMKQMVELGAELNDHELIRDPYKDFYAALDHTVLSLYPDIIKEYNSAATDESRLEDEESMMKHRTLNTRLRIYALRRLGIDKSADIARMLNVSIRTVYNNR